MLRLAKKYFLKGLDCRKRLYLCYHRPELAADVDAGSRDRMETGLLLGKLARLEYPGGVLVEGFGDEALAETQRLIAQGVPAVFEATLEAEGLHCKVDVLVNKGDSWEVHEVKSSKVKRSAKGKVLHKGDHLDDVGFQLLVAQKSGLDVSDAQLVLVNPEYRQGGRESLFEWVPVLDAMEDRLDEFDAMGREFQDVLEGSEPHELMDGRCKQCEYFDYCFSRAGHDDVDDILRLANAKKPNLRRWRESGINRLTEIPIGELADAQVRARRAISINGPVTQPELLSALQQFKAPIYFLDFEAAMFTPPHYPGTAPYEVIPFQWSCHITDGRGEVLEHREFLHPGDEDPRPAFGQSLEELLHGSATVVVYSNYEQARVKNMGDLGFANSFLAELFQDEARVIDLLDVVRENVYHPLFKGSFSIKTVLPALVEKPLYDGLEIADGASASLAFKQMVTVGGESAGRLAQHLLAYCKVDTLAMVEVYRKLLELAAKS